MRTYPHNIREAVRRARYGEQGRTPYWFADLEQALSLRRAVARLREVR